MATATGTAQQPVSACLGTPDLVAIAESTCSRDELDTYLDHLDACRLCAGVVARLLGWPFASAEVSIEAAS